MGILMPLGLEKQFTRNHGHWTDLEKEGWSHSVKEEGTIGRKSEALMESMSENTLVFTLENRQG